MTEQQPPLWDLLRPILESDYIYSLERGPLDDKYADERREAVADVFRALADWLVPDEPEPDVPVSWLATWADYRARYAIRQRLLAEADRAEAGDKP